MPPKAKTNPQEASSKRAGKRPMTRTDKSRSKKSNVEKPGSKRGALTAIEKDNLEQMKRTTFPPTRFLDDDMLSEMGILDEVMEILTRMGLGTVAKIKNFTFPDLAREFFATAELVYKSSRHPNPNDGTLSFKINKNYYQVSIEELCSIYGFEHRSQAKFDAFTNQEEFWNLVAHGTTSGSPKMSLIRYPPLRIVAKFLANTFYSRKECGTVKHGELAMLFTGVRDKLLDDDGNHLRCYIGQDVNLGCLFAKSLVSIRSSTKRAKEPQCYMGAMLVPLFQYVGLHLNDHFCEERMDYINRAYLIRCETLEKTQGNPFKYRYNDRNGIEYTLMLPCQERTTLSNENIRFEFWDNTLVRRSTLIRGPPSPKFNSDTWELPNLRMKSTTPQKKFLMTAYKIQDRVNRLAKKQTSFLMNQINKLKAKLKRVSGNEEEESSDEQMPEWGDSDEENMGEDEVFEDSNDDDIEEDFEEEDESNSDT